MLILTRFPGQTLTIGDDIVVEVLGVAGRQVRLGITAPADITILRHELIERRVKTEKVATTTRERLPQR